jgi:nitrite reductase/ring-hydroxylating ferredoxin subunit
MSANPIRRIKVATEEMLREGAGTVVIVEEMTLALFRVGGRCYAIENACPHRGGPLSEGEVKDHVVTCPWHGWTWDLRTGANVRNPTLKKVLCFPVIVENGDVFVELS